MTATMPRNLVLILLAVTVLGTSGCNARNQTAKGFDQAAARPAVATAAPAQAPAAPAASMPAPSPAATPAVAPIDDDAPGTYAETPPAPVADPLYHWNKFWFTFNHYFFTGLMRPLSTGYSYVAPRMVRTGLANAYTNFTFPIRFINSLLQLDFTKASREFGRFMLNSTLGIGGLVDVAKSDPNLQPGNEDFGQTLGHYGIGDGFYIVWPLLGPSTLRDTVGLAGDAAANPLTWIFSPFAVYDDGYNPWFWPYVIKASDVFNRLPETLENYDSVVKPAIDPYSAVKDAYIQYRRNAVSQ
uniref:Surface lipoprotein n=1 Tax=Desulfovibrio sp. U5L TaxID=596152 RepID=I2Q0D3_9BACT